jgi:glucose-1-phosphate cytidylyltransferase
LGYKGYLIKEYFAHYFLHESDITFDFSNANQQIVHNQSVEPWKVTLVNTGLETKTGGRIKKVRSYIGDETFMMTYGDGVADVNILDLFNFHKSHGKLATTTAAQLGGRFGSLNLTEDNIVDVFKEKPKGDLSWVSAGFFILEPKVFDYIGDDDTFFEKEPLENLSRDRELVAYKHSGFWQPMDTLRDKNLLETLWQSGKAPWNIWK